MDKHRHADTQTQTEHNTALIMTSYTCNSCCIFRKEQTTTFGMLGHRSNDISTSSRDFFNWSVIIQEIEEYSL